MKIIKEQTIQAIGQHFLGGKTIKGDTSLIHQINDEILYRMLSMAYAKGKEYGQGLTYSGSQGQG
jgi:hypothetical protein